MKLLAKKKKKKKTAINYVEVAKQGEIIQSFGRPCHLSTILLKDSHLFKIAESVISFCF